MQVTEIKLDKLNAGNPIRLAAYCRVSSNSEDQLHSYAAQIRRYSEYAREHPEYELVDIYADEGLTGTSIAKRDEMLRLIRDCQKGKIDRVITKSVSRFARNTMELLETIRALKEYGVSVFFEEQGIDTNQLNSEMIVTFPGMAAQQESMAIAGNLRWSIHKRMESGEYNTCRAAYGFTLKDGQLTINEPEAAVIRRIFNLYISGMGKQSIANLLNQENVPRRNQKKWCDSAISYILNNERYMGDAVLQKRYTTDTLPFQLKYNKGEKPQYYVENSNPAIISREVFRTAKDMQAERRVSKTSPRGQHTLTQKVFCSECGRAHRRLIVRKKIYWTCAGKASGETSCANRYIEESNIYDMFTCMATKLARYRSEIVDTLIRQIERARYGSSASLDRIKEIDKEIADLAAQNHILTLMNQNGAFTPDKYGEKTLAINTRLTVLRQERRKLISEDEEVEQIAELHELAETLAAFEPGEFNEKLFQQIVIKIIVNDNTSLTFHLIGGLKLTENTALKERCGSR